MNFFGSTVEEVGQINEHLEDVLNGLRAMKRRAKGQDKQSDNVPIESGSGPVVFLPGNGGPSQSFQSQSPGDDGGGG